MKGNLYRTACYLLVMLSLSFAGCKGKEPAQEVVIYTSLDKVFCQPILEAFEEETGIKVLDVYDSEATKTTGLVNCLVAAKTKGKFHFRLFFQCVILGAIVVYIAGLWFLFRKHTVIGLVENNWSKL